MTSVNKLTVVAGVIAASIFGAVAYKESKSPKYLGEERIDGKTVIITGANSGIGLETAKELARRGGRIFMACRDLAKCELARQRVIDATQSETVFCRVCDLASLHSVRKFAHKFNREEPNLHLLINNAGVLGTPKTLTEDGFELQLGTNFIGHFVLTNMLLDKMKETGPSRIINLTSATHVEGKMNFEDLNGDENYDPIAAYNQSKLANILFTRELARRLKDWCVTSYVVSPGFVYTDLFRHMSFKQNRVFEHFAHPLMLIFLRSPLQGVQTTLYCALAPELEKISGHYYEHCVQADTSDDAMDDEAARRLWATAEKWTTPKTQMTESIC
uniref:Retinol dehydrogenase 13 n=1 Tax=Strigamia maritima TaxID=126957 RepID=T1J5Y9_STRMM